MRGGVAGMFFGGSGGGAAKQSRERGKFSSEGFRNTLGFLLCPSNVDTGLINPALIYRDIFAKQR